MRQLSLEQFREEMRAQGVPLMNVTFRCPMCGTLQSAKDLIRAGAGKDFDEVEKYLGFSCVGRFTGAGAPSNESKGKGCNWTLGGLFQLHKLELLTDDGKAHPQFELATPAEAQEHMSKDLTPSIKEEVNERHDL